MRTVTSTRVWLLAASAGLGTLWSSQRVAADDLVVNGGTVTMHGRHYFDSVRVINGGRIVVGEYDGGVPDHSGRGNLELVAPLIHVDATSSIDADGAGYRGVLCRDGEGPAAHPTAGGRGGCAVMDSGGGGAHFGGGGRGTRDISGDFIDPHHWEQDCGDELNPASSLENPAP